MLWILPRHRERPFLLLLLRDPWRNSKFWLFFTMVLLDLSLILFFFQGFLKAGVTMRYECNTFYCLKPRMPVVLLMIGQSCPALHSPHRKSAFCLSCSFVTWEGIPRVKLYRYSSFHSLHGLLPLCMSYIPLHEFTGLMHLI